MKRLSIAVSLAASMWACDGSNPTSPTEPPRATPPAVTYTLSGVVSEVTEHVGVEGARVEVSNPRLAATSDRGGSYRIAGVVAGPTSVTVSSEAFETVRRDVTIDGDTRLDIAVIRRPTYTLSGVVSEMTSTGQVPVEGVHVVDNYHHVGVRTDATGLYSFAGYYNGFGPSVGFFVSFTKEGYEIVSRRDVTINGNTRLDVQLVRR